jgi:dTDP-4-amino-4,6-dideoxygalactose transaminase
MSALKSSESYQHLPFSIPEIGEEEISEVIETLRSGWLTTGPKTKRFEMEFGQFLGQDIQTVAVNSATAGLHLSLEAIGTEPGDEIITTPYTFTATAEVARYLGAHPVFVDIDPITLNIDATQIESRITEKTRAIIPVHLAGLACEMQAITQLAKRKGLRIVEDAAHALPSTSGGVTIGALDTDATVFSFYATKPLATGEGGMIATRSAKIADRCRVMRLHGIDRDAFGRYTSTAPAWFYEVIAPGFKYNMTDIEAAIGIQQLYKLKRFQQRRRYLAARYSEALAGLPITLPADAPAGETHAWHIYVIRLHPEAAVSRNELIDRMSQAGIGCSVHFIPLHLQPFWRDTYHLRPEDFPNATKAFHAALSLPLYTRMTDEDQDRVIATVRSILDSGRRDFSTMGARQVGS